MAVMIEKEPLAARLVSDFNSPSLLVGRFSNLPRNSFHAPARKLVSRTLPLAAKTDFFFFSPIRQKSRESRPSACPRFPVDFAFLFTFSNNTHVESLGFSRVRGIAISPTPCFLEENAIFFADFFPTIFQRCGFTRFRLT
jgi:hypothetical protein